MNITYKIELNNHKKKDRTQTILLRITKGKEMKRVSTGVSVFNKDFSKDAKHGNWIKNLPSKTKLNEDLEKIIDKYKDNQRWLVKNDMYVSPQTIIDSVATADKGDSFLEYYKYKVDQFEKTKSIGYHRNVKAKYNTFKDYLITTLKKKDLKLKELSVEFLKEYEGYLKQDGLGKNTIIAHKKVLRTIFYEYLRGLQGAYQGKNPFLVIKVEKMVAKKHKLSEDEIYSIEELKLEKGSLPWHTRNLFLFAFYGGGIRIGDALMLRWENVSGGRIAYGMKKNDKQSSVVMLRQAKEILKHYESENNKKRNFVFPFLEDWLNDADAKTLHNQISSKSVIVNRALKEIQDLAKIESNLSFHIARHSVADLLRRKGTSMYDIRNLLKHSSVKQTEAYLNSLDNEASDSAMEKVFSSH